MYVKLWTKNRNKRNETQEVEIFPRVTWSSFQQKEGLYFVVNDERHICKLQKFFSFFFLKYFSSPTRLFRLFWIVFRISHAKLPHLHKWRLIFLLFPLSLSRIFISTLFSPVIFVSLKNTSVSSLPYFWAVTVQFRRRGRGKWS